MKSGHLLPLILSLSLLLMGGVVPTAYAQTVPGCEFPPIDEPDDDGDECYEPPDMSENMGDPSDSDTSSTDQPGEDAGEPISLGSGNMYMHQQDYRTATQFPLAFVRNYNSMTTTAGPLGANWSHNFNSSIKQAASTSVQAIRSDGKTISFTLSNGTWLGGSAINSRLTQLTDASGATVGWIYRTANDDTESYDGSGLLRSISNRAGAKQTLTYASGHLASVSDAFGRTIQFAHDAGGRIIKMTDASGRPYRYAYDGSNNLVSVTHPDGSFRQYLYENASAPNQMTGLRDENDVRFASWTYDSAGHATSSQLAGGVNATAVAYDFRNGTTTVTDALGHTVSYDYFTVGGFERTLHVNQPSVAGGVSQNSFLFDTTGNVTGYIDFLGNLTSYTVDATRNLEVSRTLPSGQVINTTWSPLFRLPTQIRSGNSLDTRTYDKAGNLTLWSVSDTSSGLTRSIAFTYNVFGQVLTATDGNGNVTTLAYDKVGNLASVMDALGHKTTFTHNTDGRVLSTSEPNGLTTRYDYDSRGRLVSRTMGPERQVYEYDAAGQLISLSAPSGFRVALKYDGAHRLTKITDGFGNYIVYTLDAVGNRVAEQHYNAANTQVFQHSWTFDALNRVASTVGAAGNSTSFTYDDNSNRHGTTDALGNLTSFAYDGANRLVQSIAPDSGTTAYSYDTLDHLVSVSDPRNIVTQYGVDALNDTVSVLSHDAGSAAQTFDNNGNLISRTDANGSTLLYRYDALNRLTAIVRADTQRMMYSFTYDQTDRRHRHGIGHLTSMYDAESWTDYSYDLHGRMTSKTQSVGGVVLRTRYRYDPVTGNLRAMVTPGLKAIRYTWASGRLSSMTLRSCRPDHDWDDDEDDGGRDSEFNDCDSRPLVRSISWLPFGGPASWTLGNGQIDGRSYDLDGRVSAESIDSTINYDGASRISAVVFNSSSVPGGGSQSYSYDSVGRLAQVVSGDKSINLTYGYDLNGNRLLLTSGSRQVNYTIDMSSNRLLNASSGPTSYTYDANGNTLTEGGISYSYDLRGRLATAVASPGSESYYYNGLGQRVKKAGVAGTVLFQYDQGGRLIGEYDGAGNVLEETIYLGALPVAVIKPSGLFYVHSDYRNAPRRIDDGLRQAVWLWTPTSFGGEAANENPQNRPHAQFSYNLRFPGQYYDGETGLNYNYFRDYNPRTGRYNEGDPVGLTGGINVYAYAKSNPISVVDPFGLCPPGSHPATSAESQAIANAADAIVGKDLTHDDIQCNEFVNQSINNAFPGTVPGSPNSNAMRKGEDPFQTVSTPAVGELAVTGTPGHVVIITGVSNGQVTAFVGSQSSSGPDYVTLPDSYWSGKFNKPGNVTYLQICIKDAAPGAPAPSPSGPLSAPPTVSPSPTPSSSSAPVTPDPGVDSITVWIDRPVTEGRLHAA